MKKDQIRQYLAGFEHYWEFDLGVRIRNCEEILSADAEYANKNQMLNIFANTYIENSINSCLLVFYEIIQFLKEEDEDLSFFDRDEIRKVVKYRNKLVAHPFENKISGHFDTYSNEINEENRPLFGLIKNSASLIIDRIAELGIQIKGDGVEYLPHFDFNREDVEKLAKASPDLILKSSAVSFIVNRFHKKFNEK